MEAHELLKIISEVKQLPNIKEEQNPILKKRGLDFAFSATVSIDGKDIGLSVGLSKHFPLDAPQFFVKNWNKSDRIPHIEEDGRICYTHDESLVLDSENPAGIIRQAAEATFKTLEDGFTGKNQADFMNEFEAYWGRLENAFPIFSNLLSSDNCQKIKIGVHDKFIIATNDTNEGLIHLERLLNKNEATLQFVNAIYIPFKKGLSLIPPAPDFSFTLKDVFSFIYNNVIESDKKRVTELLKGVAKNTEYVLIAIPQPNGFWSFIGFRFSNVEGKHPMLDDKSTCKIEPMAVTRLDKQYLVNRGGIGVNLFNKSGLVIGCGALGGFVAEEIVRSGILNLALIDKEVLMPENIYRHALGYLYVHKKKSDALKDKLERYYPHVNINSYADSIENLTLNKKINFSDFNFVIVATGNMPINVYLSRYFRNKYFGKPIIFGWIDPYGIGGHCLVTNVESKGCYHCLYQNDELYNTASFAAANQIFDKSISGCGSTFIPYGSLDATQTANLIVRKTIALLQDKELKNALYSWKGDPELFLQQGYKLSARFSKTDEELLAERFSFYNPKCRFCNE